MGISPKIKDRIVGNLKKMIPLLASTLIMALPLSAADLETKWAIVVDAVKTSDLAPYRSDNTLTELPSSVARYATQKFGKLRKIKVNKDNVYEVRKQFVDALDSITQEEKKKITGDFLTSQAIDKTIKLRGYVEKFTPVCDGTESEKHALRETFDENSEITVICREGVPISFKARTIHKEWMPREDYDKEKVTILYR